MITKEELHKAYPVGTTLNNKHLIGVNYDVIFTIGEDSEFIIGLNEIEIKVRNALKNGRKIVGTYTLGKSGEWATIIGNKKEEDLEEVRRFLYKD